MALAKLSERTAHLVRWVLVIAWGLLILSLFYDPYSSGLTDPSHSWSPFRLDLDRCVLVQGQCLPEVPYALGAPIFWGMVVPSSIFILFVFGHDVWRRICPLSFISQIPRAMGWERKRLRSKGKTGKSRYELVKVSKNSWLAHNYLYLQLCLFFLGLCSRILFVNSDRLALGIFLVVTVVAALVVGFLYGGKTWCQYFCPMAPVQKIYAEPRGLLNSTAHEGDRQKISQSMCRTVSPEGQELSACVACQSPCIDIDAERAYWDGIQKPEQQWLYYGYVGIAVGYFTYYYLYAGNWDYYFSGAWSHEAGQLTNLFKPGLYLFNQPVELPKLAAVPMTLAAFALGAYGLGRTLEQRYRAAQRRRHRPHSAEIIRHRMFTLCTFFIFNFFFIFAGHNFIQLLPAPIAAAFPLLIAVCSSLWLARTWQRCPDRYQRERLASRLRKQLGKLGLDAAAMLEGRSLGDLTADEVYVLAKVLPGFSQEKRLQAYKGILREAIEDGYVEPSNNLANFQQMRQELDISDSAHEAILLQLAQEHPELFEVSKRRGQENALRLGSYREQLLGTILHAWREHPEQAKVAELMQAFSKNASSEVIDEILQNLSKADRAAVQAIRQEYSVTAEDEISALRRTEPGQLWQMIADSIGLLDYLSHGGEEQLRGVFQQIDSDHSGHISLSELQSYIQAIAPNITLAQVENMLKQADTSGDAQVSYGEFQALVQSLASHQPQR